MCKVEKLSVVLASMIGTGSLISLVFAVHDTGICRDFFCDL